MTAVSLYTQGYYVEDVIETFNQHALASLCGVLPALRQKESNKTRDRKLLRGIVWEVFIVKRFFFFFFFLSYVVNKHRVQTGSVLLH